MTLRLTARALIASSCCALLLGACASNQTVVGANSPSASDKKGAASESTNTLQVSDVAVPNGSKLDTERSLIMGGGDKWLGRIVLKVDQPPVQVYNHFYQGMPGFGWSLVTAVQASTSIQTYQRGDRVALIQIDSASMSGSQVSITVTSRQAGGPETRAK